ncbi:thioredoxin family protein [Leptobacterium flavescens]|uniref:Thioredoxin family protein n=1 Tax=Leptobacterium flavescens TaxID=472055 RepID=A0A6P0UMU7_9FLAO|nr:thioredoxin family protein [Leptobacterium flavescens]NER14691.1 thioredoxin family protein [Leptobacterium flavescens]
MDQLIKESVLKGISYEEYMELVGQFAAEGRTSGAMQTKERIELTKLNASRMRRLDKTLKLSDQAMEVFKNINTPQDWLVIVESWCADGAQTLPVLNKIAEASPAIDLKIVFRDENDGLMDAFLTNGARAIPKLIVTDKYHTVLDSWGARSKAATGMVKAYKEKHGKIDDIFKRELQIWYNKDKGVEIVNDLLEIVQATEPLKEGI